MQIKNVFSILLVAAGIFTAASAVRMFMVNGGINELALFASISAGFLICGIFFDRIFIHRWLSICAAGVVILTAGLWVFIAVYGNRDTATYTEDALIVLGAGLRGDRVSLTLAKRLETALVYHQKNPAALIIVSGGIGPRETVTEAFAMARYLGDRGVPADLIHMEESSVSTYQNIVFSKQILDSLFQNGYTAAIVTNDFHVYRAVKMARAEGIECTSIHSDTPTRSWVAGYVRECAAVVKFWLLKQ